jgi:hypothetical protein
VLDEKEIVFGNDTEYRKVQKIVKLPETVQNNGSLYAHVFFWKSSASPDPSSPAYDDRAVVRLTKLLTVYEPKRKAPKLKKLLGSQADKKDVDIAEETESDEDIIVAHWNSNLTFTWVAELAPIQRAALPPALQRHINLTPDRRHYHPIFCEHDFWVLSDHYVEINSTVKELPLRIELYPLSLWKFQIYKQMAESFRVQETMLGQSRRESEQFKAMLTDSNPVLLVVTMVVSLLHSVFDMLAFKNDISFWRNQKSLEGLSVRTIMANVLQQSIILLYLFDNDTSWMILISSTLGLGIEAWKVTKAVDFETNVAGGFPWVKFKSKQTSKLVKRTQKYDQIAFKYLSLAMVPLLIGYTVYSVFYMEHKSWFSFILGTLVGFVYAFGFISMTPQLYINYKLKSVAHVSFSRLPMVVWLGSRSWWLWNVADSTKTVLTILLHADASPDPHI